MSEAIDHRYKIFHGQLTSHNLSRHDLLACVTDISGLVQYPGDKYPRGI
jgi:hypothetical protein